MHNLRALKTWMLSDEDARQRSHMGLCLQKMSGIGDYRNKSPFVVAKELEEDGDCQWVWGTLFEGQSVLECSRVF